MKRKLGVWLFKDGKPGHEKQVAGVVNVLADSFELDTQTYNVRDRLSQNLRYLWPGRYRADQSPDLILGAGHATHLPMLAAKLSTGARIVVLMKPSLPKHWFDLCVVPSHDGLSPGPGLFVTTGAVSDQPYSARHDEGLGLILLGGPSRHFGWHTEKIAEQVDRIATDHPDIRWTVANSRRSPAETLPAIASLGHPHLVTVDHAATEPSWLSTQLMASASVWVSEDSVSMIYEALTSGARTGLLQVPRTSDSRITQGVDQLAEDGWVTTFAQWNRGSPLKPAPEPLNEASRLVKWMISSWL